MGIIPTDNGITWSYYAPKESQQFMKDWFDIIEKFALPYLDDTTVFLEELNSHHLQIDLKI